MCAPWPRHTLVAEVPDVRVPLAKTMRCRAGSPYLALPKPEQASLVAHRRRWLTGLENGGRRAPRQDLRIQLVQDSR
jgi:hypothetical protein